jgi:hypothetical protein
MKKQYAWVDSLAYRDTDACEREWDQVGVDLGGWWCINDHTGCLYNDGHNECTHEGNSLNPLEEKPSPLEKFLAELELNIKRSNNP